MDRVKEMRMVMMMVMLMKTITTVMIPSRWHSGATEREEERFSPLCFFPHGLHLLVLGLHGDEDPSGILLHGHR